MDGLEHRGRVLRGWLTYRVGPVPLAVFGPLGLVVAALTLSHTLANDVCTMIATLATGGFFCAWLGGLLPWLRRLGAPAIVAAFLSSYLVYRHWLPVNLEQNVTTFTKQTSFIYLYITAIIVGSIFGMNRKVLLRGLAKIWLPLMSGSLIALLLGMAVGSGLGMPLMQSVPMVIVPIMAGGVGEARYHCRWGMRRYFTKAQPNCLPICCRSCSSPILWPLCSGDA